MMQAAPMAPSAPAIVAVIRPVLLKFDKPPWAPRPITGTITPIRKYATPTQSSAFNGFPSWVCPRCSSAPYAPQDSTAPTTKINHTMLFGLGPLIAVIGSQDQARDFQWTALIRR